MGEREVILSILFLDSTYKSFFLVMEKNFLKKQIISNNTAMSNKNATAPMVLEMTTVSNPSEISLGIEGEVVAELTLGVVGARGASNMIISVKKIF